MSSNNPDNFWPTSGYSTLERNSRGWLVPTDDYFRLFLARPELALVEESCPAEISLHQSLLAQPSRLVQGTEIAALADADVQANFGHFLQFRDGLMAAGTLEAYYLILMRSGQVKVPPLFVDLLVQACLRNVLNATTDAVQARAGEMLFRPQRIHSQDGQILSGDQTVLDLLNETGGLGDIGRLLVESNAPLRDVNLEVLNDGNAQRYWQSADRHNYLLDLTHEVNNDLSHGLVLTMTRARSGLTALSRVLEQWVQHFLGVSVTIKPEAKIEDANWRWHVGLDVESSALLNDLYEDRPVETVRMQRLLSLFRLTFNDPGEMRADVAGKPVYLALAMTSDKLVKLKPQNLLLNLPIRALM